MGVRDVERFEQMLYADVFRGEHSTGVFSGFNLGKDHCFIKTEKAAVPGYEFLETLMWENVKSFRTKHATIANSFVTKNPSFLVGHNRYATMGSVTDENAHPFTVGAVTLCHNGTLTNQSLLPDHTEFAVDSHNIAHAINKEGIDATVQKLHGAFTLVWHDARDNTLNFLRNTERPFHMLETSSGDYFGASEKDMLMWIMKRKTGYTIKRDFSLEPGTQYVFDVSNGFKFKEERKHELPTFRSSYVYSGRYGSYNSWYNDYDDDYDYSGRRSSQSSTISSAGSRGVSSNGPTNQTGSQASQADQHSPTDQILRRHGIFKKVGEQLPFDSFQFDEYPRNKARGKVTGYTGSADYIEVQAHGVEAAIYEEGAQYTGKIMSAYEMNHILHIVVGPIQRYSPSKNTVSVSEMVEKSLNKLDSELAARLAADKLRDEEAAKKLLPSPTTTTTTTPSEALTDDEISKRRSQVVVIGGEDKGDDEGGVEIDITSNGIAYTRPEWERNGALNSCAGCGSPISFDEISDSYVQNGFAFCPDCCDEYAEEDAIIESLRKDGKTLNIGSTIDLSGESENDSDDDEANCFVCRICAETKHTCLEYDHHTAVCIDCHKTLVRDNPANNVVPLRNEQHRIVLQNGMSVTKPIWEKMNNCTWCNRPIPWHKAAVTMFYGQKVCCEVCDEKLEAGIVPVIWIEK